MASLWVIDPSVARAEDQGVAQVLAGWNGDHRVFRPALSPGDGPGPATGYATDGVVLLGSAASVHDDRPWIRPLADWLRPLVLGQVTRPLLGICFGHQLIAHLAGGHVGYVRADRSKLLDVQVTRLAGGRLLPGPHELQVVASHREAVRDVPRGFRSVAWREESAQDGLEHETLPVYTFQFHPEARDEFARGAGLDPARIDERVRRDGGALLAAFHRTVRESRGGSAGAARP